MSALKAKYQAPAPPLWTRRLDAIFLHPVAGPLVFRHGGHRGVSDHLFLARKPADGRCCNTLSRRSGNWIGRLISDPDPALAGGRRGLERRRHRVVKFLPQILMLFLFIGILEDSGYLARAALIADRTMARFGLQGKSFIPLLSAYACAVPAIMATRTIENKRDRIATILIAPFMTCSARLPMYTLMIAAFIPDRRCSASFSVCERRDAGLVHSRFPGGDFHGEAAQIDRPQEQPILVHAGDASVSLAHSALARPAAGGPLESVPAPRGDRNPGGGDHHLGSWRIFPCTTASRRKSDRASWE